MLNEISFSFFITIRKERYMKRSIKKQVWLNRKEAQDLQKKADKACLEESTLIRVLITGYQPKEKPDERFYEFMDELRRLSEAMSKISDSMYRYGADEAMKLSSELDKLHKFEAEIEKRFLKHDRQ